MDQLKILYKNGNPTKVVITFFIYDIFDYNNNYLFEIALKKYRATFLLNDNRNIIGENKIISEDDGGNDLKISREDNFFQIKIKPKKGSNCLFGENSVIINTNSNNLNINLLNKIIICKINLDEINYELDEIQRLIIKKIIYNFLSKEYPNITIRLY